MCLAGGGEQVKYDLIVIGAGPGGYVCAIRAAQLGLKTAVIEKGEVGGTCLNRGCIPVKALLHSAEIYRTIAGAGKFGIRTEGASVDVKAVFARKDEVSAQLRGGVETLFKANGIDLYRASARVTGGHKIALTYEEKDLTEESSIKKAEQELAYENLVIASGSVPAIPPVPGIEEEGVLTSDSLLKMDEKIPESLVIIGGGVIAVEFAQVYLSFGTKVTILEMMPQILPNMDKDIARGLAALLKKEGVDICTGVQVTGIRKENGRLIVTFSRKEKEQEISCENVLAAVGRRAYTEGLFGEECREQIRTEKGKIITDKNLATSLPDVYAIGDVTPGVQLAHSASAQGICVAEYLAAKAAEKKELDGEISDRSFTIPESGSIDLQVVPACVYTSPEIACVGLTEKQAVSAGYKVRCGKYMTAGNGKSVIRDEPRGFVKVVFDEETDRLLGAQLMCARATDMIGELATAIANAMTSRQLLRAMRAHPTVNEAIGEAIEASHKMSVHTVPSPKRNV